MKLQATRNDLPEKTRQKMVELLNARLADAIDLKAAVKQAHWNVKGPGFIGLHKMFDDLAGEIEGYVDELAERVVQLGGLAAGTLQQAAKNSSLKAYPADITDWKKHVEAVADALAAFVKQVRKSIDEAEEAGDQVTMDVLIEVARGVDKWLWFVEAHLA